MEKKKEISSLNRKLSNIFSAKNKHRTYKIYFKGEDGEIIFKEYAQKEWVLQAFLNTARVIGKKLNRKDLPKTWLVDDKQRLEWLSPQIRPYIENVQDNIKKKFPNFLIWDYKIQKMEFEEKNKDTYEIRVFVKIRVSL